MTIERGRPWGAAGALPPDGVVVRSDAEARAAVLAARAAGRPIPVLGLLGGDLCRTVGGTGDERRLHGAGMLLPVDLVEVTFDGRPTCAVAHVLAHRPGRSGSWWRGQLWAAMNAQFAGRWDLAPRSHPNDGRVDVLEADTTLGFADRWKARSRLAAGLHVPHPHIHERRVRETTVLFERPLRILVDGRDEGSAVEVTVTVSADALTVCV